jgi:hypothetical protein
MSHPNDDDLNDLFRKIAEGDEAALRVFLEWFVPHLASQLREFGIEVDETWDRALEFGSTISGRIPFEFDRIRDTGGPGAWLRSAVRDTFVRYWRRQAPAGPVSAEVMRQALDAIYALMEHLSDLQRRIVLRLLRRGSRPSDARLAEELGVTPLDIHTQRREAARKLESLLDGHPGKRLVIQAIRRILLNGEDQQAA